MNSDEQQLTNITDFCEVSPCNNPDFSSGEFKKLTLDSTQKANMSMFFSQLPTMVASDTLAQAYIVTFPDNVAGSLMELKSGGFSTPIIGASGKIEGHASLHKISGETLLLKSFAAMSIATGQYFLTQINNEFKEINQKIDEVLDFLYGEKKAELMAEISFVQFAYKNFKSIMQHDEQRAATITNLQAAKKVAMKDIEFYMNDLMAKVEGTPSSYPKFESLANEALQIKNTLEASMQLYIMSGIMESYYAENSDPEFIDAVKEDMLYFVNKCEARILKAFNTLNVRNNDFASAKFNKPNTAPLKKTFDKIITPLSSGEDSPMHKAVNSALDGLTQEKKYCITSNGDVYLCS